MDCHLYTQNIFIFILTHTFKISSYEYNGLFYGEQLKVVSVT